MKYTGTQESGATGATTYTFTVGKEELALLCAVVSNAYKWTPNTIETLTTHGRLRNMDRVLARIYLEEVKGRKMPTKNTGVLHERINRRLAQKIIPI